LGVGNSNDCSRRLPAVNRVIGERSVLPLSGHSSVADRLSQEGGKQPLIQRYPGGIAAVEP
jgi:hypothetical protein